MALKAGRVGVAPDQVDEFGQIKSEATSGYTKQEADAKFETQIHAASTYETKADAAALQPKTLAVPISMLDGSKLTVEAALEGFNTIGTSSYTDVVATLQSADSYVRRNNHLIDLNLVINGVTAAASGTVAKVPAGYRPDRNIMVSIGVIRDTDSTSVIRGYISPEGNVVTNGALSNENIRIHTTYIKE